MNHPHERTHDITLVDYHVKDLATFGKKLTEAATAAFPRGRSRYTNVHVLLLSWEDDNLGVMKEVRELEKVFADTYNYHTERFQIPSSRSHNSLARRLTAFLDDFEGSKNLLIVYYGGHGFMNDDRQCLWSW